MLNNEGQNVSAKTYQSTQSKRILSVKFHKNKSIDEFTTLNFFQYSDKWGRLCCAKL